MSAELVNQLLMTIAVSCGITALLALLMVIAEATIGNYGEVEISVNDKKKFTVSGGASLLTLLAENKLFIPSACGGRGSCGMCKVVVTEGAGPYLPTELPWISADEQQRQVRLACQIKVKNNLAIEVAPELFDVRLLEANVLKIRDLTHDIKELTLALPEGESLNYKPGQFVQFLAPRYPKNNEEVYRAYSISSHPEQKGIVELEIRLVPQGICTTYVHNHLQEGDKVTITGPYGDFLIRDSARDIIFIAGGSGNAPIKSMLDELAAQKSQRTIKYFFGARTRADLVLPDYMGEFSNKLTNYSYFPVLSQPSQQCDWQGETGWVTDCVKKNINNGAECEAYLCGSPAMIDTCITVLGELGISEERIFYDKFA